MMPRPRCSRALLHAATAVRAEAILLAWQRGCKMDGWDQCFDFDKWMQAFRDCGLDPEFYASRQRPMYEVFPWDHIGCGTRKGASQA